MASAALSPDPSLDAEWEEWKMKFEKTYSPVGNMGTAQGDFRKNGPCCWESVGINVVREQPLLRTCLDMHFELKGQPG